MRKTPPFLEMFSFFTTKSPNATCCRHVGVGGDAALVGHALLDVGVLVHQHHGHLLPGARPFLSSVSFACHQMGKGPQLIRVLVRAAWVQLHLEGVTLFGLEWGAEDGLVVRGVLHHLGEVSHPPNKLRAGCLGQVDVVQRQPPFRRPGSFLRSFEDHPKLGFDV